MARSTRQPVRQSALLPFQVRNGQIHILLVTTSSGKGWIIPKGNIPPYLTPEESAAVEAYEEAGALTSTSLPPIGIWHYRKRGRRLQVEVFPAEVDRMTNRWPEKSLRERAWFPLDGAMEQVHNPGLRRLISQLPAFLVGAPVEASA